jgi:hypothetical protein
MHNCLAELSKGLIVTMFAANAAELFDEVTAFNDTDRPVRIKWTNTSTGNVDYFFVPHGGKAFTHKLNIGSITNASFNVSSWDGTLATGKVTINLAKNHS